MIKLPNKKKKVESVVLKQAAHMPQKTSTLSTIVEIGSTTTPLQVKRKHLSELNSQNDSMDGNASIKKQRILNGAKSLLKSKSIVTIHVSPPPNASRSNDEHSLICEDEAISALNLLSSVTRVKRNRQPTRTWASPN